MCRLVPSGFRLVQATFIATPINSTNFLGRTPSVQGLVVILRQVSAHSGSHSRSCAKAESQGPASLGRFVVVVFSKLLLMSTSLSFPIRCSPAVREGTLDKTRFSRASNGLVRFPCLRSLH